MSRALVLAFGLALCVGWSVDAQAGETRLQAVQVADTDNNMRLDTKEMKALKNAHPKMYTNLLAFCEVAKQAPKKNGVDLPASPTKQQLQCKKCHVAKPFITAWTNHEDEK